VRSPTAQVLRARTAGRSAGVGRRRALAGSVTPATVLPVMSKKLDGVAFLGDSGYGVLLRERSIVAPPRVGAFSSEDACRIITADRWISSISNRS
jgi:hypothetical protein